MICCIIIRALVNKSSKYWQVLIDGYQNKEIETAMQIMALFGFDFFISSLSAVVWYDLFGSFNNLSPLGRDPLYFCV